jgi:hypothetical protein
MEHNLDSGQEVFFFTFTRTFADFRDSVAFMRAEIANWAGRVSLIRGYVR